VETEGTTTPSNSGHTYEVLRPGAEFTLFRGHASGEPNVLAVGITGTQAPPPLRVERLLHASSFAADLDPAWAVRPLALSSYEGQPMLLLEDFGGEPLDMILAHTRGQPLELARVLRLATNLAWALRQMHERGLIHRDLKPANVLVADDGQVRLTGFGIASRLPRERQALGPPEVIAGTFAYMAPEQTGRMNRSMDARSDLYSLGVTLYELVTGTLPFTASNPLEWIHCHIARQPAPPSTRVEGVPAVIDAIILKLLAKDAEDRYQTAAGVEADLRRCLEELEAQGNVTTFTLGERDSSERLLMPEKLYGREAEIDALRSALERVTTSGAAELVLLSGYSGIGKSSIVNELHKVVSPAHSLFATGKFDRYQRDIPYATLAQAFRSLTRQLLGKHPDELARWRDDLKSALGQNGQLMVSLIPELELVIGAQPTLPRVEPQDAPARFYHVFRSLLGVFARPDHPLVLFVDDLQWLDAGTLELLQRLATDPEVRHLMLIGAYRDNEVGDAHPLRRTIEQIRVAGGAVSEITVGPLLPDHVSHLAADALRTHVERVRPLAALVHEKTGGNPFFAIQFIVALEEEGLLTLDRDLFVWKWDLPRIRAKGITDNVAELMAAKLGRLSPLAREMLGRISCRGGGADVRTICLARGMSEDEVHAALRGAVEAGLIIHADGFITFTHDRVQEAAYALIPESERAATHLLIARALLTLTPEAERAEHLFEIVNQFDRGVSALESPSERTLVAELNLAAGRRARMSSAYSSASAYFTVGRELLGDDRWDRHYRLTFDLELQQAECDIVAGAMAVAEARLATLSQHAVDLRDRADVVCLSVLLYFSTGRSDRAVEAALAFLSRVGIEWSSRPSEVEVRHEYLEMRRRLAGRTAEDLFALPPMSDPDIIAIMAVLSELHPAAYAVDRYLMELVLLRMTNLSLEYGNAESSSVAYSAINMAIGSHFSDYAAAFTLGQLACELVDRRGADRVKARVYSLFSAFTMPWTRHLPLCLPLMRQAFEIGTAVGDMAYAAYNSRNLLTHLLASGVPLDKVQREAEQTMAYVKQLQLGMPSELFIRQLELVQHLRAGSTGRMEDDAWAMGDVAGAPQLAMMVAYHWVFRLEERYFAGDFTGALEAGDRVEIIRWAMRSSIEEAEYVFYAGLAYAAACDGASPEHRDRLMRMLTVHHESMSLWAEHCPENFANRKALLAAETARLEDRPLEAQSLYEEAIQLAHRHGFLHNEALACELAGKFHVARGLTTSADAYLRIARDCYERWGAYGKVRQLDARYPHLRQGIAGRAATAVIDAPVTQLDVETVDRASQTLSSEMVLPTLLEKLVRLAVEHAGAERGLLILLHGDEPHIEAKATTGRGSVEVTVRRMPVTSSDLPQSALHFALRTRERLVLDDASTDGLDADDLYVQRHQPKSVLCLPIFKQNKVIGALYLENNLTTCAFTSDRVAVLDFLASQAAIWLENARLYSDLRRSEAWLREAQHLSSTGSFYWRVAMDSVEFSEQTYRTYEIDPGETVTLDLIRTRIHPEDIPIMQEMVDIARGPATDLDHMYRARMPNGTVKHLHLVAHATRDRDGQLAYLGAIHDVTQAWLAEQALSKARSELAHVARVTSLGALTASIAHEVNQPLAGIITNASTCVRMLAADPPNLEGARETVRRMIRDGNRASEVITRLRALFGKEEPATEPVDLNDATREVIALSLSELQRGRISLRAELADDLPPVVGDRVQLQQVVLNLLLNASEAMNNVEDRPRQLVIRTAVEPDDQVQLSVQDSGVGIGDAGVEKCFEAFYTTKHDGMGMGLSVSRSIVESHYGRLWATPNEGPGATFSFSIPRANATQPADLH